MRKEAVELKHKDYNCNDIAVRYLIVGIVLCFLASLGYTSYIKWSEKEIEVRAVNSNSNTNEIR